MKLSMFMTINAVVALLFGIASLFAPQIMLEVYGAKTINAELIQMTRFFSSGIFCYAAMTWFARNAEESEARRAIVLALIVSYVIGLIVTVMGYFSGVVNMFAWLNVGLYVFFLLGYGYSLLANTETKS
jgi:cation transport ATPase